MWPHEVQPAIRYLLLGALLFVLVSLIVGRGVYLVELFVFGLGIIALIVAAWHLGDQPT